MWSSECVCVKGAIPLHVLWPMHWVQFWKIYNTYSRAYEEYRILLGFWFPNSEGKYRVNGLILDYDAHWSRQSSNFVWVSSNAVHNIFKTLGLPDIAKTSSTPLRCHAMSLVLLVRENIGLKGCNGIPRTNKKAIQQVEEISRMILLSVFVLPPAGITSLLQ